MEILIPLGLIALIAILLAVDRAEKRKMMEDGARRLLEDAEKERARQEAARRASFQPPRASVPRTETQTAGVTQSSSYEVRERMAHELIRCLTGNPNGGVSRSTPGFGGCFFVGGEDEGRTEVFLTTYPFSSRKEAMDYTMAHPSEEVATIKFDFSDPDGRDFVEFLPHREIPMEVLIHAKYLKPRMDFLTGEAYVGAEYDNIQSLIRFAKGDFSARDKAVDNLRELEQEYGRALMLAAMIKMSGVRTAR